MRIKGLDIFRGIAIILMIIYHFCYFLNEFNYIHQNFDYNLFWRSFRAIIVTMFIFASGVSLHIAYHKGINWQKFLKRVALLGAVATAISVATYIVYPNRWVYFGIIHYIFASTIIGLLFINRFFISLIVAILLFVLYFGGFVDYAIIIREFVKLLHLPSYTVDLVPLFPWFWVTSFALAISAKNWHKVIFNKIDSDSKIANAVAFMGRHSLVIYLTHLPLLFGLFLLVRGF